MKVLLTNDDGITATGLNVMRRALLDVPDLELAVIAPDANRSATARSITIRHPALGRGGRVRRRHHGLRDRRHARRLRSLRRTRADRVRPELIVSGINHGANLGDDITYSGTVAAALEGIMLGIPAIAVSQQADHGAMDFRAGRSWGKEHFESAAAFVARLVEGLEDVQIPEGTLLNVNVPAGDPSGVRVGRLGKREYNDRMELAEEDEERPAPLHDVQHRSRLHA